ncbi:AsmA-like C-terminal domain-containing protein [Devosia sp.]|uniref:AsmA-like C-terminal domain-containing protein n=1 Tax=Devosia sp. TaxID=1871048 RepID=UPI0032676758
MNAVASMPDMTLPHLPGRPRSPLRRAAKISVWALGVPALLLVLLYLVLLATPVKLPFGSNAARAVAMSTMPPTSNLQLGDMALALEGGIWPVIQFSPVVLTDTKTGARIEMGALEVGFSPMRALFGQPGATVTMVAPHIQMVQDLLGPRITSFQLINDPDGGPATVRVMEGADAFPSVDISASGVSVRGTLPVPGGAKLRSDNDWLIFNLEASEQGIAQIVDQATQGRFSKLVIRDGVIDMNDSVYGLFRHFENISLTIAPSADLKSTQGVFSATLGGKTMDGSVARTVDDAGGVRLEADVTNIDFASFLPFIDDPASLIAIRGAGALSIDVNFAPGTGKLSGGAFKVDMTGLDMRIKDDYFPIATSIMDIAWSPDKGQFTLADAALQIGQSSARISGIFAMGLDAAYGPTIGMSLHATNLSITPGDMTPPAAPFSDVEFSGWSAPLYGALGIDRLLATKGDGKIETTGRVDMLQAGLGFALTIAGEGISADDLKRLWPSVTGGESRAWFVANVREGEVKKATMKFNFPVGTLAVGNENKPIPKGAMLIDMVGTGVAITPTAQMMPIAITGDTRLQVRDADVTISADGGTLPTSQGPIQVSNAAMVMDNSVPTDRVIEVSGDVSGTIPAILALAKEQQPEVLKSLVVPLDINALAGTVDAGLVTTVKLADEPSGRPASFDYVLNGSVKNFSSSEPIQGHRIGSGQLNFSASQAGYQIGGTAAIDGMKADVSIDGAPDREPVFKLASSMDIKDLAAFGFDASEFLSGKVRFVGQPMPDGSLQMAVDLKDAALTIKDLAISKPAGVDGIIRAAIKQDGDVTELSQIDLAFGTVHLAGGLKYDAKKGLQSADFSSFALSAGDDARVSLVPITGGYGLMVRGAQLDLKPLLRRFFGLGEGSGGVEATQFNQTLALDIKLDRALGSYATTAFNLTANMLLKGSDLRKASLAAQFGDNNGISITTNPTPDGRTMSVAFNDAGTVLRLLGIYSQLAGGEGSLVLNTFTEQKQQVGELQMRNFAIVDEANVAQILGNHSDSRAAISKQNRLDFDKGEVKFVRRSDRVEVSEAILSGQSVGGTARGFIYTDQRQYDLTGTYVPLFGLNSVFQKIPLLGPILGGRDGEGLVGVTFQVKGPLDHPEFRINPLSILVPGAFRELFEFRAKEQPRVE